MKVYLMTDLEGVAGVYQWENRDDTGLENHERRVRQRRWLAEEVNAAVDGLFAGGATEVIVNDGHGAGYTIDMDIADPRAIYIHGRERPFWLPLLDETCDFTGIVGGHAKADTEGANLHHTMTAGIQDWSFNGLSVGEMGLQALIAGHFGVPFAFCSGDLYACQEMEELIPGCVTVPVKCGLSRLSAATYCPRKARERIREGAARAAREYNRVQVLKMEGPIVFREVREKPTYDPQKPPPHSRVIDEYTREITGIDIVDVMCKIHTSYPPGWHAPSWP